MGINDKLIAIHKANAEIREILEGVFLKVIVDLNGQDPEKYTLYAIQDNGLYLTEDDGVVIQGVAAWGEDYSEQVVVPMSVIDNGTIDEWIIQEKAQRIVEADNNRLANEDKAKEKKAAKLRIFRGEN
jgi:hypothetical protein